jgi:hypothetical protein
VKRKKNEQFLSDFHDLQLMTHSKTWCQVRNYDHCRTSLFLNGGYMKHQQAPKWLLTTALLAVLGANYSFQSSSLTVAKIEDSGVLEMSLVAAPVSPTTRVRTTASPTTRVRGSASPTTSVSPTTTVSPTAAVSAATGSAGQSVEFKFEGKTVATGTCLDGSCKSVVLDAAALREIPAAVLAATRAAGASVTTVATAPASAAVVAADEYDCDFTEDGKPETRSQKRDRLKCVKDEKERIRSEERIANFEDKMDMVKDRCDRKSGSEKLTCLNTEFSNALRRYSGRNALPANVVQRYFKSVVGSELSKMLFNSEIDTETAMSALQDVFDGMPSEYSVIRQNILGAIKTETEARAKDINEKYKQADIFAKQNKSAEFVQTFGEAQAAQQELGVLAAAYSAAAKTSDSFTEDTSFASYYQRTYIPQMNKILAGISPVAAAATTPDKPAEGGTRQNTRGGTASTGTGSTAPATRGQASGATLKTEPTQWEFLGTASGVRSGTPSNTPNGSRGARSMNN